MPKHGSLWISFTRTNEFSSLSFSHLHLISVSISSSFSFFLWCQFYWISHHLLLKVFNHHMSKHSYLNTLSHKMTVFKIFFDVFLGIFTSLLILTFHQYELFLSFYIIYFAFALFVLLSEFLLPQLKIQIDLGNKSYLYCTMSWYSSNIVFNYHLYIVLLNGISNLSWL